MLSKPLEKFRKGCISERKEAGEIAARPGKKKEEFSALTNHSVGQGLEKRLELLQRDKATPRRGKAQSRVCVHGFETH